MSFLQNYLSSLVSVSTVEFMHLLFIYIVWVLFLANSTIYYGFSDKDESMSIDF